MQILLNGETVTLDSSINILELIEQYQLSPQKVAVELNLSIVQREDYTSINLNNGDKVEIVEFVGGG